MAINAKEDGARGRAAQGEGGTSLTTPRPNAVPAIGLANFATGPFALVGYVNHVFGAGAGDGEEEGEAAKRECPHEAPLALPSVADACLHVGEPRGQLKPNPTTGGERVTALHRLELLVEQGHVEHDRHERHDEGEDGDGVSICERHGVDVHAVDDQLRDVFEEENQQCDAGRACCLLVVVVLDALVCSGGSNAGKIDRAYAIDVSQLAARSPHTRRVLGQNKTAHKSNLGRHRWTLQKPHRSGK